MLHLVINFAHECQQSRLKDQVIELMERLGITGHQLQSVTLGPGVVGRNSSIAFALLVVMAAGVISGAFLHSELLVGLSVGGAIVGALLITCMNVHFGHKNPAAAILEGLLQFDRVSPHATLRE